jgi:hypothetical protein
VVNVNSVLINNIRAARRRLLGVGGRVLAAAGIGFDTMIHAQNATVASAIVVKAAQIPAIMAAEIHAQIIAVQASGNFTDVHSSFVAPVLTVTAQSPTIAEVTDAPTPPPTSRCIGSKVYDRTENNGQGGCIFCPDGWAPNGDNSDCEEGGESDADKAARQESSVNTIIAIGGVIASALTALAVWKKQFSFCKWWKKLRGHAVVPTEEDGTGISPTAPPTQTKSHIPSFKELQENKGTHLVRSNTVGSLVRAKTENALVEPDALPSAYTAPKIR